MINESTKRMRFTLNNLVIKDNRTNNLTTIRLLEIYSFLQFLIFFYTLKMRKIINLTSYLYEQNKKKPLNRMQSSYLKKIMIAFSLKRTQTPAFLLFQS